jgi:hypothetical protein
MHADRIIKKSEFRPCNRSISRQQPARRPASHFLVTPGSRPPSIAAMPGSQPARQAGSGAGAAPASWHTRIARRRALRLRLPTRGGRPCYSPPRQQQPPAASLARSRPPSALAASALQQEASAAALLHCPSARQPPAARRHAQEDFRCRHRRCQLSYARTSRCSDPPQIFLGLCGQHDLRSPVQRVRTVQRPSSGGNH